MRFSKTCNSACVILCLTMASAVLAALVTSHLSTDAELLAALQNVAFIAEGRIGDLGGAATFELDIGDDTGNPAQTEQHTWPNAPEPFTLAYDKNANLAMFTLGGDTLTYSPGLGFSEMFIRTRAVNDQTSVIVDNLVLNGQPVGDQSAASGPDGLDILVIAGVDLDDGFVLTGVATLNWVGSPPTQSRLAFQIKVGNAPSVPVEESTWGDVKSRFR